MGINNTQMSLVFGMARDEDGRGGPLVGWLVIGMAPKDFSSVGEVLAVIVMILLSQATAYW